MASHGVLEHAQGADAATGVAEPETCLNCGAALTGPYCAACGQKKPHLDLTLRELLHEAAHELTHWDGKLPATLKALFLRPGSLTLDFLAGRRARWLPPLRLYLICSVAFFLSRPIVEAVTHRSVGPVAKITITDAGGTRTISPEDRRAIAEGLPGRIFTAERLERAALNGAQLDRIVKTAYPKAMFLLVPFFALLTNLAWKRRVPRYPAHLYAALHLHAAWFGALTVATLLVALFPFDWARAIIRTAVLAYVVWYSFAAMRRLFDESRAKTIAKSAAVALVYAGSLLVTSLLILAYALFTI